MRLETSHATFDIGHLEGQYHEGDVNVSASPKSKARALRDASAAQSEARQPGKSNGDLVHGRTIINGKVQSPKTPDNPTQSVQRAEGTSGNRALSESVDASPRNPLEAPVSFSGPEQEAIDSLKRAVGEVAVATTVAQRYSGLGIHENALAQQVISGASARFGNNMSMHNGGGMP